MRTPGPDRNDGLNALPRPLRAEGIAVIGPGRDQTGLGRVGPSRDQDSASGAVVALVARPAQEQGQPC